MKCSHKAMQEYLVLPNKSAKFLKRNVHGALFGSLSPSYLTLEVPEILHYPGVPSGIKLALSFIDAFYIFKFQLAQP